MLTLSLLASTAPAHTELVHSSRVSRAVAGRLLAAHAKTLRTAGVPYRLTGDAVYYIRDGIAYAYGITSARADSVAPAGRAAIA